MFRCLDYLNRAEFDWAFVRSSRRHEHVSWSGLWFVSQFHASSTHFAERLWLFLAWMKTGWFFRCILWTLRFCGLSKFHSIDWIWNCSYWTFGRFISCRRRFLDSRRVKIDFILSERCWIHCYRLELSKKLEQIAQHDPGDEYRNERNRETPADVSDRVARLIFRVESGQSGLFGGDDFSDRFSCQIASLFYESVRLLVRSSDAVDLNTNSYAWDWKIKRK